MVIKDFLRGELIGLKMEIIDSKNKNLIGIKGEIIDETKNSLIIQDNDKVRTILKKQVTVKLSNNHNEIQVNGELLIGRPEDRLKK